MQERIVTVCCLVVGLEFLAFTLWVGTNLWPGRSAADWPVVMAHVDRHGHGTAGTLPLSYAFGNSVYHQSAAFQPPPQGDHVEICVDPQRPWVFTIDQRNPAQKSLWLVIWFLAISAAFLGRGLYRLRRPRQAT